MTEGRFTIVCLGTYSPNVGSIFGRPCRRPSWRPFWRLMRRLLFPLFGGVVCLALLCAALAFVPCRAEDIKKIQPIGYVSDFAGAIDSGTKVRLEALCAEVEQKTGAQMAIVTVHSLEGETASQYANELFKQWGI